MIPKIETCIYAIEQGVEAVVILDGKVNRTRCCWSCSPITAPARSSSGEGGWRVVSSE